VGTLATSSSTPDSQKRRSVLTQKARAAGKRGAGREKMSLEAQKRISDKIKVLVDSGEVPNTPKGRTRAAGMAYGMERSGRLQAGGKYTHVKK